MIDNVIKEKMFFYIEWTKEKIISKQAQIKKKSEPWPRDLTLRLGKCKKSSSYSCDNSVR